MQRGVYPVVDKPLRTPVEINYALGRRSIHAHGVARQSNTASILAPRALWAWCVDALVVAYFISTGALSGLSQRVLIFFDCAVDEYCFGCFRKVIVDLAGPGILVSTACVFQHH